MFVSVIWVLFVLGCWGWLLVWWLDGYWCWCRCVCLTLGVRYYYIIILLYYIIILLLYYYIILHTILFSSSLHPPHSFYTCRYLYILTYTLSSFPQFTSQDLIHSISSAHGYISFFCS
jgi:hypothetical protein